MSRCIALIPARGGSKGIPGKNLANLNGSPLINFTIEAALKSKVIDDVVVNSDADNILDAAVAAGAKTYKRPRALAEDDSDTNSVIDDFIRNYQLKAKGFDTIILLQPTSPLRTVANIEESMLLYQQYKPRSVISVSENLVSPYRSYTMNAQGQLNPLFGSETLALRRQDYVPTYAANGALYIFDVEIFSQKAYLPLEGAIGYLMASPFDLDIDTPQDLDFANFILSRKKF